MRPITTPNEDYIDVLAISADGRVTIDQPLLRAPKACPYQAECWKFIRAPLAKKGYIDEEGIKRKMYVPYICSFSLEGDLSNCGHLDKFEAGKYESYKIVKKERDKIDDGNVPTSGLG